MKIQTCQPFGGFPSGIICEVIGSDGMKGVTFKLPDGQKVCECPSSWYNGTINWTQASYNAELTKLEDVTKEEVIEHKTKIILMSGKKRSGKNTFAERMIENIKKDGKTYEMLSFAKHLKENSYNDTLILTERINNLFDEIERESVFLNDNVYYKKLKNELYTTKKDFGDGEKTLVSRSILEFYGTQIFRDRVDEDYWIKCTYNDIKDKVNKGVDYIFLTDCRFENEINYIYDKLSKSTNINIVRVNRPSLNDTNTHISNTALDNYEYFNLIATQDTLDELYEKADKFYEKIK